jgi:hypothetical protein
MDDPRATSGVATKMKAWGGKIPYAIAGSTMNIKTAGNNRIQFRVSGISTIRMRWVQVRIRPDSEQDAGICIGW